MGIDVGWRSQAGVRTDDNRDCGGVGIRGDEALCVIADGSSTAPDSGALTRAIIRELVDWYVASDPAVNKEALLAQLPLIHERLSKRHPRASASYLIVHIGIDGKGIVLHAGDCLLGCRDDKGAVQWLTRPHTLANATGDIPIAEIADLPSRHRLTRSFRSREYLAPEIAEIGIEKELLLATDGFWADLRPNDQARFAEGEEIPLPANGDDRSILRIRREGATQDGGVVTEDVSTGNFYVRARQ